MAVSFYIISRSQSLATLYHSTHSVILSFLSHCPLRFPAHNWNLPSNPVDLEQREGRINRFECLALRRNVASLFCSEQYQTWNEMFDSAREKLKGEHSDIVPYWCLPINALNEEQRKHLQYIERIVPLFPLSRDRYRYERLIKVLALYRMTMGQPRQEELLDLLSNMNLTDEQIRNLTIDLCPFDKLLNTEKH